MFIVGFFNNILAEKWEFGSKHVEKRNSTMNMFFECNFKEEHVKKRKMKIRL
jgi:hypothetical protein